MKKGISLLILVLTIMVLSIITTTVVLNIESNNTIKDSKAAVFLKDTKDLYAEFQTNFANKVWKCRKCGRYYIRKTPESCIYQTINKTKCNNKIFDKVISLNEINLINGDDMKLFIPDFPPQYYGKLVILNGEICAVRANLSEEVIKKIEETKALKMIDNIDPNHKNMKPKIPNGFKESPKDSANPTSAFVIEKDGVKFSWVEVPQNKFKDIYDKTDLENLYNQGMTAEIYKSIEENRGFYMSVKNHKESTVQNLINYSNNLLKNHYDAMTMVPTSGMYSIFRSTYGNGSFEYDVNKFELTLENNSNGNYIFYRISDGAKSTNPNPKLVRPVLILL